MDPHNRMKVIRKSDNVEFPVEYAHNRLGNKRIWVDGRFYSDKDFVRFFTIIRQDAKQAAQSQAERIQSLKLKAMEYKLIVKETGSKSGKYFYQVVDETGKVIKERKSNREYVACTVFDNFYFGRLDLIGKGDHGRMMRMWSNMEDHRHYSEEEAARRLKNLMIIAYK